MKQKLKNKKGLTLMEMLCTVVIVVLMSALLATGIALAASNMSESVTASEAKVLCDTITTKLCYYINRDGLEKDYVTINVRGTDGKDTENKTWDTTENGPRTQAGQILWRGSKLVPSKTYPSLAAATVTLSKDTWTAGENVTVTVTVCNRITGREYCHNIIRVLIPSDGGTAVVNSDEADQLTNITYPGELTDN